MPPYQSPGRRARLGRSAGSPPPPMAEDAGAMDQGGDMAQSDSATPPKEDSETYGFLPKEMIGNAKPGDKITVEVTEIDPDTGEAQVCMSDSDADEPAGGAGGAMDAMDKQFPAEGP